MELLALTYNILEFVWLLTQNLSQINSILEETLQAVGAKAMVVGHTPQTSGVNWYEESLNMAQCTRDLFMNQ